MVFLASRYIGPPGNWFLVSHLMVGVSFPSAILPQVQGLPQLDKLQIYAIVYHKVNVLSHCDIILIINPQKDRELS